MGQIFSFHVINKKTQVQFEVHSRKEDSWANILRLRPSVRGILADGVQSKAKKPIRCGKLDFCVQDRVPIKQWKQ